MELCHVQFRKSRLEKEQEQTAKAKDKSKTKIMAEADAKLRDNAPIQYCKFCNLEVLLKKNTDGKLILAGA
jgi:hypothetical protein